VGCQLKTATCMATRRINLISRTGNDWTEKFGTLPVETSRLPVASAIIDGEVVILGSIAVSLIGTLLLFLLMR